MSLHISAEEWNLRTPKGIPYKLMEGFPKGSFEEDDCEITEEILIESDRLGDFIEESFNDLSLVYPGGSWSLYDPGRRFEGTSWFPTKKVSFEPFPPGKPGLFNITSGGETYTNFLKLTIVYGTGKTTDNKSDMLEVTGNATGEFLLVPTKSNMYWVDKNHPAKGLNVPVTQIIPGIEWSVKYKRIEWSRFNSVLTLCRYLMGTVNSYPMPQFNYAPAETILFVGFSWTHRYSWRSSLPVTELELKLIEKNFTVPDPMSPQNPSLGLSVNHNMFLNPDGCVWQTLYREDGSKIYKAFDLNQLFYQ